jgi:hypothetical protein
MLKTVLAACALLCALNVNAEARPRLAHPECNVTMPCEGVAPSPRGEKIARQLGFGAAQKVYTPRVHRSLQKTQGSPSTVVAHPPGCPRRAFCGCGAAVRVFGSPVRSLWLAANWLRFPRTSPAPGMVAARRGHVFVLEAHLEGKVWRVYDANSGGRRTRIHARSIAGYQIVNPHGGRHASLQ